MQEHVDGLGEGHAEARVDRFRVGFDFGVYAHVDRSSLTPLPLLVLYCYYIRGVSHIFCAGKQRCYAMAMQSNNHLHGWSFLCAPREVLCQ